VLKQAIEATDLLLVYQRL